MSDKPNCYECKWRHDLPGDAHSGCANNKAHVTGNEHGIRMGWFFWTYNFDPTWLESCDGFEPKARPGKPLSELRGEDVDAYNLSRGEGQDE